MLVEDVNRTIDIWINALEQYSFEQLRLKPSPDTWSLGQVYMHLIDATDYFISQSKVCLSNNNHTAEDATAAAKAMFLRNDFPDEVLEGPPSNAVTPQPESKEQLAGSLLNLKNEIKAIEGLLSTSLYRGKTKHPGLGYFNAREWLQFAEMHLRHHLRQKKRIDHFLNITAIS